MEETTENSNGRRNTEIYFAQELCSYILVAIKNLFKCLELGFESENSPTSDEKDKKDVAETSSQEPLAELPADPPSADPPADQVVEQPADPPADLPADPPANPTSTSILAVATVGRTPAPPPIGRGRGGQTN